MFDLVDAAVEGRTPAALRLLRQMLDVYEKHPGNVVLVEKCRREDTRRYGIIDAETMAVRTATAAPATACKFAWGRRAPPPPSPPSPRPAAGRR